MIATHTTAYNRTHTAAFLSDKMRNLLKIMITYYGLNPTALMDAWTDWVDRAARTWLESGHLAKMVIEFYAPGQTVAAARWDFPIRYDGNGTEQMWVDREFFDGSLAKSKAPPPGALYRILLVHYPGEPQVPGICDTTFRALGNLVAREAGTAIATPDLMASATYYR
jgi:hypothetical protein